MLGTRSSDISAITSNLNHTTGYQTWQDVFELSCGSGGLKVFQPINFKQLANHSNNEQVRWSVSRMNNAGYFIPTVRLIRVLPTTGTLESCITRSNESFGFL